MKIKYKNVDYYNINRGDSPLFKIYFPVGASRYEKMDLKNWKPYPELVPGKGKYLAIQGEKDLASLAERIRAKLPMLFDWNVTKNFKVII